MASSFVSPITTALTQRLSPVGFLVWLPESRTLLSGLSGGTGIRMTWFSAFDAMAGFASHFRIRSGMAPSFPFRGELLFILFSRLESIRTCTEPTARILPAWSIRVKCLLKF
jgi:hypothetical protein